MLRHRDDDRPALILSFHADGPRWDNLVRLIAYPAGMSYFRPFRYREKWVDAAIKNEIGTRAGRRALEGQRVIVAMRFTAPAFRSFVVPIRDGTITHIDEKGDNISVYFTLGLFYDEHRDSLADLRLMPRDGAQMPQEPLFFQAPLRTAPVRDTYANEDDHWERFSQRFATDQSLPISAEARQAVFVRLCAVRQASPAPIEKIHSCAGPGCAVENEG